MNEAGKHTSIRALTVPRSATGDFDGDAIKIGFSRIPERRLPDLQISSSRPLKILGFFPGTQQDEQELHVKFLEFRLRGEWFNADKQILKMIGALKGGLSLGAAKRANFAEAAKIEPAPFGPWRFPPEHKAFLRWAKKQNFPAILTIPTKLAACDLDLLSQGVGSNPALSVNITRRLGQYDAMLARPYQCVGG